MNDTEVGGKSAYATLLLALLTALVLLAVRPATPAQAAFGGLGPLGSSVAAGEGGGKGEVNPFGNHSFAVDVKTGNFFIADDYYDGASEHYFAHIQEFTSAGVFLGQESIRLTKPTGINEEEEEGWRVSVGGLAVDPEAAGGERVYLLLVRERPEEEEVGHAISNPEAPAAAALYEFSTAVEKDKLTGEKELANEETLKTFQEGSAPLLFPRAIAVDPKTHDVVIVGRQNDSTSPADEEAEEEFERTAVQRVHANGTLGPRYVDTEDCLYAHEVPSEPECERDAEEFGSSVIVSSAGRVLVQDWGEEIWEIPAAVGSAPETFKEVPVIPRHVYSVAPAEETFPGVLEGESDFGNGNTMSYVASSATEGRIYLDARYGESLSKAVAVLDLNEAGGALSVKELGWTAGQPEGSTQKKCVLALGPDPIAGTDGEGVLVLSLAEEATHVMKFGPGGEACGSKPEASAPSVSFEGQPAVSQLPSGEVAELSSTVTGADATSEHWTFRYQEAGGPWQEEAAVQTSYHLQSTTTLEHAFTHVAEYEVIETVDTDNLSYPQVTAPPTKLKTVPVLRVNIAQPENAVTGSPVALQASVTGSEETTPRLSYRWSFGDGVSEEGETEGSGGGALVTAKHTYSTPGTFEVTLEIKDKDGQSTETNTSIEVTRPRPTVLGEAASSVTQSTATLNATVNPNGDEVTTCRFEYGTSTSYESSVPCLAAPGSGTSPAPVSASVTGLNADTPYHFRIVATNTGGTSDSSDESFETLPNPPTVLSQPASSVTQSAATLNATVNPNGREVTTCRFEYGTTTSYGSSVPCLAAPGSGTSPAPVSASVTGLNADTPYHFRIVATNAGGTSDGSDEGFSTQAQSTGNPNPSTPGSNQPTSNPSAGALPFTEASIAPTLTGLAESHTTWREGTKLASFSRTLAPLGTAFSLALNEPARVTFKFDQKTAGRKVAGKCVAQTNANKHKTSCARVLARGSLAFAGHAGENKLTFQGRLTQSQQLAPGSYAVLISAETSTGRRSTSATLSFTIAK